MQKTYRLTNHPVTSFFASLLLLFRPCGTIATKLNISFRSANPASLFRKVMLTANDSYMVSQDPKSTVEGAAANLEEL